MLSNNFTVEESKISRSGNFDLKIQTDSLFIYVHKVRPWVCSDDAKAKEFESACVYFPYVNNAE